MIWTLGTTSISSPLYQGYTPWPTNEQMERAGNDNKDVNYLDVNLTIDDQRNVRTKL